MKIREIQRDDLSDVKEIVETSGLFPSDMLDEMISGFLEDEDSGEIWLLAEVDSQCVGFAYCAPEMLTEGTYNLYAIATKDDVQGQGIGGKMLSHVEDHLKQLGHRILIVDTSGTDEFESSRLFYESCGYQKEAVIRDYWSEGDDKVTYWKRLKTKG